MMLNPRAENLLKILIERYISDGQPVGSRTLARELGNELSPATIRNVMSDLEELGLIRAPHTSAGRIPTPLGYRVFVDTLLKVRPLDANEVRRLEGGLSAAPDSAPAEPANGYQAFLLLKPDLSGGRWREIDDPELGVIRQVGTVIELSETPGQPGGPAPYAGQHNDRCTEI